MARFWDSASRRGRVSSRRSSTFSKNGRRTKSFVALSGPARPRLRSPSQRLSFPRCSCINRSCSRSSSNAVGGSAQSLLLAKSYGHSFINRSRSDATVKQNDQLRQILLQTRAHWDRDETPPSVRSAFDKALQCRTPALGAEVFASKNEEYVLYHPCKSRPCSSCGYRSTVQWQRERWAALPNVPYKGVTFTMPDVLWPFFRDNPDLTRALPALASKIIQSYVGVRFGLRVGVIAILHTFNGKLEFNSHVHTMVTAGGLGGTARWNPSIYPQRSPKTGH
jgi:hypothetical protein